MTVETISESEYRQRVTDLAQTLTDQLNEDFDAEERKREHLHEYVEDIMYGEDWFARTYYGAAAYGCIVEHGGDHHIDPGVIEAEDPVTSLKRLAHEVMRYDVMEAARERIDADADN